MKNLFVFFIICIAFFQSSKSFGSNMQDKVITNLNIGHFKANGTYILTDLKPGTSYEFRILGFLPFKGLQYSVNLSKESTMTPPLPMFSEVQFKTARVNSTTLPEPIIFTKLKELNNKAYGLDIEEELPLFLSEFEGWLSKAHQYTITGEQLAIRNLSDEIWNKSNSYQSLFIDEVEPGQIYKIEISRIKSPNIKLTWNFKTESSSRGRWQSMYGYNFIHNSFTSHFDYTTRNVGNDSFKIIGNGKEIFTFLPTVMFTWLNNKSNTHSITLGGTFGFGFNLKEVGTFGAFAVNYNQNISLNIGLAGHVLKRLAGQYNVNDIVKENLTSEQLTVPRVAINPFISINFRLDKSPFSSAAKDKGSNPTDN